MRQRFEKRTRHLAAAILYGYLKHCTDDFIFNVPGRGGISGIYIGKQGLYELAGKAMALTDGTFHEEVEEVLASDRFAVVLARHRFTRNGASRDYKTAHVYEIRGASILPQCFEQPRDSAEFHDA